MGGRGCRVGKALCSLLALAVILLLLTPPGEVRYHFRERPWCVRTDLRKRIRVMLGEAETILHDFPFECAMVVKVGACQGCHSPTHSCRQEWQKGLLDE